MSKPQLSDFIKAMRKQHAASRAGTISAERRNIIQSPNLQLFTRPKDSAQASVNPTSSKSINRVEEHPCTT